VAVDSFDVDIEVVLRFFLLSIVMVVVLIGLASLYAFVMYLVRKSNATDSDGDVDNGSA
jgi:uncharacterized membrane protein|tara:strand:- start:856 stop:1032 length:177 start_codon:yes stop_codon:yes gene_type:complete